MRDELLLYYERELDYLPGGVALPAARHSKKIQGSVLTSRSCLTISAALTRSRR
jgi:hypothetical protein